MEKKMETTLGFRGLGIIKRCYGDSEKKMEATIQDPADIERWDFQKLLALLNGSLCET